MPLSVNGKPIKYEKNVIKSLTENVDWQKKELSLFEECISSNISLTPSTLIVLQGECASIKLDKFDCIGTPFATTCNIIFILNKSGTKIICAHLDEGINKKQLINIFKLFTKTELQKEGVNLYLIGGYLDEKSKSIIITDNLFTLISNEKKFKNYNVNLCLLLTSNLNTNYKMIKDDENKQENKQKKVAIPKYQNVGYNLKENKFIIFDIRSKNIPYYTLRGAVIFDSSNKNGLRVIYDCCNKKDLQNGPKIESFKWNCPDWINNVLSYNLSDDKILKYFSTSPYAEHDEFAKDSKALFKFVAMNNPKEIFKNGKSIYLKYGIILKNKQRKNNKNNHNKNNNDDNYMEEEKSSK